MGAAQQTLTKLNHTVTKNVSFLFDKPKLNMSA